MPATDTIHWQIKQAVIATIQGLDLASYDNGNPLLPVLSQLVPDDTNTKYPCIFVTSEGETDDEIPGTTEAVFNVYPVRVFIADRNTGRQHAAEPYYLDWRHQIRLAFTRTRFLANVNNVRLWQYIPQVVFDPKIPVYQLMVSGQLFRFVAVESRGG